MSDTHSGNIQFPYIGQYLPVTNWAKFFNFNPTFDIDLFAENEGDRELEQRVLNEVGSYGKQLGRVMKVLRILLEECEARGIQFPSLDQVEVDKFRRTVDARDAIVGDPRRAFGPNDTERVLRYIQHSHDHHPAHFEKIAARCAELQSQSATTAVKRF